jgi:subtilisin family serine protease
MNGPVRHRTVVVAPPIGEDRGVSAPTELPAWSASAAGARMLPSRWPHTVTREWAWGDSTGRGVRVCVLDSGIETGHPRVGPVDGAVVVTEDEEGRVRVTRDEEGDVAGHGTACGGIIRSLAPDCALHSVRVLGPGAMGTGAVLLGGLQWAVEQGFDVINLSLSTRKRQFADTLRELSDLAYFQRTTIVASAHNMAVVSFPWRFASVISVGSHESSDPLEFHYNPRPPVEFFARGVDLDVAWLGGESTTSTGNSFATAHIAGVCALILAKHPGLTAFELKSLLYLTASNVDPDGV